MAMTSIFTPKTPTRSKDLSFLPLNSSPLASSPGSSPVSAAQARRRSQYKSHTTNTPGTSHSRQSSRRNAGRNDASSSRTPTSTPLTVSADENRRAVLRERFRSQCLERAHKDRQRKIDGKRRMSSEFSSDGPDEMMDFEGSEDEDAILNDEVTSYASFRHIAYGLDTLQLFGRIMSSVKRKQQHQYRLSYAQEVGSSFDPDFDDVTEWENELLGMVSFEMMRRGILNYRTRFRRDTTSCSGRSGRGRAGCLYRRIRTRTRQSSSR